MDNNIQNEIHMILKEAKAISTTSPNKSYTLSKEAFDLSKSNHLKSEEGYALIGMSLACRAKSENNIMLEYSYGALELFETIQEPIGQVRALNLIGIAYFYNSEYEQALRYLMQALDLLEVCKDYYLLSCVLNNIGEVFRESIRYEEALEYYNKALQLSVEANSNINTASLLGNIGDVYYLENKNEEALEYFTKSYNILLKEKDQIILGEIENKLGNIYYINNNISKAVELFSGALEKLDRIDNKFYAIDVLLNMAKLQSGDEEKTPLYYYEKAIQYAEATNAKKKLSAVYKTVAAYYENSKDYENALEYFKKHHRVEVEITTSIVGNKFELLKIELEHLDETHKFKETEMINQRLEKEILNQKNELERIQKINEILEGKAYEDELTCIPNRRYINYHLNKTWEGSLFQDQRIALFIIDIDNFKKYNDSWGHVEGDRCLQKVASCLKAIQSSRNDVFGRYGGEEFIYYAINISFDQTLELGNLFRFEVGKLLLNFMNENENRLLTISVGGAWGKLSDFNDKSNLIQIADEALYKAKDAGRNSTVIKNMRIKP